MGWTKRQLVMAALAEIGVAQAGVDLTADELADACRRLDAMMGAWDADGIHIGYPISGSAAVALDTDTALWVSAVRAVVCNLAVEVAPMFGREPMRATVANAKRGLSTLQARTSAPPSLQLPATLPAGAGSRWSGSVLRPFVTPPVDHISVNDDSFLDLE
jgi:hypothetical protein